MRCEACQGSGMTPRSGSGPRPCAACGGCGIGHCCDGDRACPVLAEAEAGVGRQLPADTDEDSRGAGASRSPES